MKKQQMSNKVNSKAHKLQTKMSQTPIVGYYCNEQIDEDIYLKHNYKVVRELGRGGYGVVYKAVSYNNGVADYTKKYAIKVNFSTVSPELIYAEIGFLRLVKGQEHLPQLVEVFVEDHKIFIVIQYFSHQPFITYFTSFNMQQIKEYLKELLQALLELKRIGIYHRDVKPGNFLYNPETKKGILVDFGLSEIDKNIVQTLKNKTKEKNGKDITKLKSLYNDIIQTVNQIGLNKIGTESFMPLESILNYKQQSYEVDIWAVGVIFLQFLTKKYNLFTNVRIYNKPNQAKNFYFVNLILELSHLYGENAIKNICSKFGYDLTLPITVAQEEIQWQSIVGVQGFDNVAQDLLMSLLQLEPSKRITVEDALNHPFFSTQK